MIKNEEGYDEYFCSDCKNQIKIIELDNKTNTIKFECFRHGIMNMKIKEYLEKFKNNTFNCSTCGRMGINRSEETWYNPKTDRYACRTCFYYGEMSPEEKQPYVMSGERYYFCNHHPTEENKIYCQSCQRNICSKCLKTKNHKKHEKIFFEEIEPSEDDLKKINNYISKIQKSKDEYQSNAERNKINDINYKNKKEQLSIKIKEKIIKTEGTYEKKIKEIKDKFIKEKENAKNNYKKEIKEVETKYRKEIDTLNTKYQNERNGNLKNKDNDILSIKNEYIKLSKEIDEDYINKLKPILDEYDTKILLYKSLVNSYEKNNNNYYYIINVNKISEILSSSQINLSSFESENTFYKSFPFKEGEGDEINDSFRNINQESNFFDISEVNEVNEFSDIVKTFRENKPVNACNDSLLDNENPNITQIHLNEICFANVLPVNCKEKDIKKVVVKKIRTNLYKLSIMNTHLKDVNFLFDKLYKQLKYINFENNKIKEIDNISEFDLPFLEIIDFSHNKIMNFPKLDKFITLKEIILNWNEIQDIKILEKIMLENVVKIEISNNKVKQFPKITCLFHANLKEINLLNNPINAIINLDHIKQSFKFEQRLTIKLELEKIIKIPNKRNEWEIKLNNFNIDIINN